MIRAGYWSRRGLLVAAAAAAATEAVQAQDFPQRPVRLVVPYGAGNVTDQVARVLAEALSGRWPQRVVVENMPGAGGALGVAAAARAAPDGHTLVLSAMAALTVTPHLRRGQVGYDPLADLAPIGLVAVTRVALAAHPALPVRGLDELAAHARRAGPVFYYSAGSGTLAAPEHGAAQGRARRRAARARAVPEQRGGAGPTCWRAGCSSPWTPPA